MNVDWAAAHSFSLSFSSAKTSDRQIVRVRPFFNPRDLPMSKSPFPGASRLSLNSTVKMDELSSIDKKLAYPTVLSATVLMTPAWKKPCCWVKFSWEGTRISQRSPIEHPLTGHRSVSWIFVDGSCLPLFLDSQGIWVQRSSFMHFGQSSIC